MRKLTHDDLVQQRAAADQQPGAPRNRVIVLLDNVRSLYNVGSIFRTCDAARVEKLILTGYTPHPPRKEITKTALGAEDSVPWEYVRDPVEAVRSLKAKGVKICAVEQTDAGRSYTDLAHTDFPICLILGNEIGGVDPALVALADMAIEIPMSGIKHSLNVSVACGVVVFEAVRAASRPNS